MKDGGFNRLQPLFFCKMPKLSRGRPERMYPSCILSWLVRVSMDDKNDIDGTLEQLMAGIENLPSSALLELQRLVSPTSDYRGEG
ncbi:MAG: hypothetical protein SVM80_04545 [Halobacteriota archaeon]|nr:hypothetical protein [Halobacteriota archaeon]